MNKFLTWYLLKVSSLIGIGTVVSTIAITSPRAEALGIVTTQSEQLLGNPRASDNARKSLETSKNIRKFSEQVASNTILNSPDGSRCEGELPVSSFTGNAVCTYPNGDRYEGEVLNAKPHGKGVMSFANGDRYEGEFQDRKFNGSGTYTFKNGETKVGQWTNDEFGNVSSNPSQDNTTPIQKTYSAESVVPLTTPPPNPLATSPLQKPPIKLFNLETANQLELGSLALNVGVRPFGVDQTGQGSALQVASYSIDYGLANNLQIGVSASLFDDTLGRRINGRQVELRFNAIGPTIKYQLLKNDNLLVALAGSVELLQLRSDGSLFLSGTKDTIAGSLQVPISYNLSRDLQVHLTPGIAFFPNSIDGRDFYGTLFKVGAGLSWQATERLNFFADVNFPIGGRGNTVNASNGNFTQQGVYSGGLRYLVNPAVGFDLYATNGFGTTPATTALAFVPDGNQLAIAANLTYTPNTGRNFAASFRQGKLVPLSNRDIKLLFDGFNLSSADTLLPGMFHIWAGTGAGTNVNVAYGLTNDVQIELLGQKFNQNGDPISLGNSSSFKVGAAAKLRFLDQVQGDPVSLSLKLGFSPVLAFDALSAGYSTLELPISYRLNPQLAFNFNPKVGFVRRETRVGLGLGVNYSFIDNLQFIGEYTPLLESNSSNSGQNNNVWSVGLRYIYSQLNIGADIYLSNSIGLNTLGGLFAQPSGSNIGFNIHWLFGGTSNR